MGELETREERVARLKREKERLKHADIKKFDKQVRSLVLELVNEHGIRHRVAKDGQHLFLYTGEKGVRPYKLASSRPAQSTIPYLQAWVRRHYPDISLREKESGNA